MKRIYIYGLNEDNDESFAYWFEGEFSVSVSNWVHSDNGVCYMDMEWGNYDCENVANKIKEKFPELTTEVFEYTLNNTPIISI